MLTLFKNKQRVLIGSTLMLFACLAASSEIKVLVTADGRGTLEPTVSDFSGIALGGLAQRATILDEQRSSNEEVVLLEAGNFLFGQNGNDANAKAITDAYAAMSYDAVNLAVADFNNGKAYTIDLLQSVKLPVISSNLYHSKDGKPLFETMKIVKKGGKKTAILALTEPPMTRSFFPHLDDQLQGIYIQPLKETLDALLPQVEKSADQIVVLYAGSATGLRIIRAAGSEKIKVVATSGLNTVAASTSTTPLTLSPIPNGRDLACCMIRNDGEVEKLKPIVLEPSIVAEPKIQSILNRSTQPSSESSTTNGILKPFQNNLPLQLPENPERNRLYKLAGLMSNRGADIRLLGAGLFNKFGTLKAREGHVLLVLRSSWENTIPLIHRRNQALATTYLIQHLGNHLYVVVNGKHMSRIYSGNETIPHALPVIPLSLPYIGMQEEGNIVFELEDEAIGSIDLRMYDYAHGHAQYELMGKRSETDEPIQPTVENEVVEAGLFEFTKSESIGSIQAEPGMTFVTLDFRATSQFVIDGDATAFDPHAKSGTRINIGTVADWLEADLYNHLVVDEQYAYRPRMDLSYFGANPRFLPDLKTGNRVIFEVPKDYQSLKLRADFPNAKLPSGEIIRPTPIFFELEGPTPEVSESSPMWQVEDDTITVSVKKHSVDKSFAGTTADEGKSFLILDIDIEGTGEKPEFFQSTKQLVAFDANGSQIEPSEVTFSGLYRPSETVWVPNGGHRAFQLVYEINDSTMEYRFGYQGYSLAENFSITSDGQVQKDATADTSAIPTQTTTIARVEDQNAPNTSGTQTATGTQESTIPEETVEPKKPRVVLTPFHAATPKDRQAGNFAAFKQRSETMSDDGYLSLENKSWTDLGKNTAIQNQDLEQLDENEHPRPTPIEFDVVYEGTVETKGEDFYEFEVIEQNPEQIVSIYAAVEPNEEGKAQQVQMNLRNETGQTVLGGRFTEHPAWYDFQFRPGKHRLEFGNNRNNPAHNYRFILKSEPKRKNQEVEWNYYERDATPIELRELVSGRLFKGDSYDYYIFEVNESDAGKTFALEAITDTKDIRFSIDLYRAIDDDKLKELYSTDGVMFVDNLVFKPGKYWLRFNSSRHPYAYNFILRETGTPEAGYEIEPNDNLHCDSIPVIREFDRPEAELYGQFQGDEYDFVALDVKDANRLYTVSLAGEGAESLDLFNHKGRSVFDTDRTDEQIPALIDLSLPVGLNYFQLRGRNSDWALNVETSPVSSENIEREPNNDESNATIIELGKPAYGRIIDNWDEDYYKVVIHQAMNIRFNLKFPETQKTFMRISLEDRGNLDFETEEDQTEINQTVYLLPGQYWIHISSHKPSLEFYEFSLTPTFDASTALDGLEYEFELSEHAVAAHSDLIQQIDGTLTIHNTTSDSVSGLVQTQSSHNNVSVVPKDKSGKRIPVTLNAGESIEIPLLVNIAPETWSNGDVILHANIANPTESHKGVTTTLTISDKVLPIGTEGVRQSSLLPELVGGINLNALMLGAEAVVETEEAYQEFGADPPDAYDIGCLIDGVIENASFEGYRATVKLAGDGSIPIVGASFDLHGEGTLWRCAKDFKIEVSEDGSAWNECFSGSFEAKKGNQQFVFPKPVKASHARLTLLNKQFEDEYFEEVPHMGEWRMIGQPNMAIPNHSFDVLHEDFGGHLILEDEKAATRVYGFHHNRAALITELYWLNQYNNEDNQKEVKMSTSMDSPVGPWTEYKTFDLSEANKPRPSEVTIPFNEPVWARFVRFEGISSFSGDRLYPPKQIGLNEQTHGKDGYMSIFAEWGDQFKEAGYEYQHPVDSVRFERLTSSESTPFALTKDQTIGSAVSINERWEDWFVIPAQEENRRIQLQLNAKPFIKFEIEITDENGKKVPTTLRSKGVTERTYVFSGEAGKQYFVHTYEPRRSVVFLWDVSGSMGSYVNSIESAVQNFAQAVNPNTEIVQLIPFDEPPKLLLEDWAAEPSILTNAIRYYEAPSSSYAHLNLLEATKILDGQQGTKAAIVITDCESGRGCNKELWEALEKVKPVVFTFQTSDRTSNYKVEQDDMQDWTAVGGGFYRATKDPSDLDIAFEKVKVFLRRPAPYTIGFSTPELKPGSIQIVDERAEETIVNPAEDGVMLLIDASASMREKLPDGKMKVSAAKKVIEKMVTEYLPPEINFGLRVFGHRGGENCKSELMLPLEPINAETVKQKLLFMRSSSLGNTSLAEGISWAQKDFEGIEGNKRLVVLTDGEETCKGDPAAEIAKLSEAGFDVMVNIVGFTLGDESTKSDYQNWVQSTNGSYYDAQDSEALGLALQKAMTPTQLPKFVILDNEGNTMATGTVGDNAVVVKSGDYVVQILREEGVEEYKIQVIENKITLEYK